jgi:fructokinase
VAFSIGLDIGGTKIAGAIFDGNRRELAQVSCPTPDNYTDFLRTCCDVIAQLETKSDSPATIGIGVPGALDYATGDVVMTGNTPCIVGKPLRKDLEQLLKRPLRLANDADCAALSEAVDGAGAGFRTVFGLIVGTGVGGGYVADHHLIEGVNGLAGEFGHLPLPFREASDGPLAECVCRQKGCIEKSVSGGGLARLYTSMTGKQADASQIATLAQRNDSDASRVLDQYYTTLAKAMVPVIHTFDPQIIVASGGLSLLPGLAEEVPKRWSKFTACPNPKTKFAIARHGAMSGLRGAAWVGKAI